MSRVRRILHPSDFSRASSAAFARAVRMAKADRAQLLIVHVLAPPMAIAGEGYMSSEVYDDLETSARRYAEKHLSGLQAKARKAGARTATLLREGVAHEQIIRAARSKKADLIVIPSHGRTGITRLLIGSVAECVVRLAHCPVLVLRK